MKIHLLIDYYISSMKERQEELDFCYLDNIDNPGFDQIHVFYSDPPPRVNDKVISIPLTKRLNYADYFEYAKNNIPQDDIIVLSNSDIYFDDTVAKVASFDLDKNILALTRWSSNGGDDGNRLENGIIKFYSNHVCSQDVWVWKNPLSNFEKVDCNFTLGVLGCDNKIAYSFKEMGYDPINPCLDIVTYHYHQTGDASRTYERVWLPPPYRNVPAVTYKMISS